MVAEQGLPSAEQEERLGGRGRVGHAARKRRSSAPSPVQIRDRPRHRPVQGGERLLLEAARRGRYDCGAGGRQGEPTRYGQRREHPLVDRAYRSELRVGARYDIASGDVSLPSCGNRGTALWLPAECQRGAAAEERIEIVLRAGCCRDGVLERRCAGMPPDIAQPVPEHVDRGPDSGCLGLDGQVPRATVTPEGVSPGRPHQNLSGRAPRQACSGEDTLGPIVPGEVRDAREVRAKRCHPTHDVLFDHLTHLALDILEGGRNGQVALVLQIGEEAALEGERAALRR